MLPTRVVQCPYCGESVELIIDDSVEQQSYVEDCRVCCRPINVDVSVDRDGDLSVRVSTDSDA